MFGAEKSVIIGFKQKPGTAERSLVHKARGTIEPSFRLIPAVAATIPEGEINNLRMNPAIAYVEENAIYTAATAFQDDDEGSNSWQVSALLPTLRTPAGIWERGSKWPFLIRALTTPMKTWMAITGVGTTLCLTMMTRGMTATTATVH